VPLNQVSTVSVGDARLLVVKPWDRNLVQTIERAINNGGLGLNASNDGVVVRVPIPPLTEERRKGLVKMAKEAVEEGRIAVRQGRRDANDFIKEADGVSEDDQKKGQEKIQKLTDDFVKKLDDLLAKKEAEIMEG
jgi:ribosome recycling factor